MRYGLLGVILCGCLGWLQPAHAQAIRLDVHDLALREALEQLSTQAGIDIVFAGRLVAPYRVTCSYAGREVEAAFRCLLRGTALQAERVRRRQYVLVEAPSGAAEAPPRGLLAGFVTDAETGEVLPGAHVYLPSLRVGTATNEAGYFALATLPQGTYPVRISYLGYQPRDTVLTTASAARAIALVPVTYESADVVVESRRSDQADLNVLPGLLALPTHQLEQFPSFPGEQDLFQALQWLPGIHRAGEINGGLVVRGGATDQNLYLLDGAPVYHPWHAFSLISTFQTETFKDIRLYRGAFPAEHGGRLSSVLEAEMKDGSRAEPGAVMALSPLSGRFIVESPITPNSSFMLAGRRSYLDKLIGQEHPVEENGRRDTLRTGYYFYDLSAKLTYRPDPHRRLSFSYYHGRDNLDLRLPFDLSLDFSSWLRPADLFFEIDHDWSNQLFSGRYQRLVSRRFFLTVTGYQSSYRAAEGAYIQPTTSSSLTSDYRVRLRDLGVKVDVDFYHSVAHQVRLGLQAVDHRFHSTLDATIERSPGAVDEQHEVSPLHAYEVVGYVQDTWQPAPRVQVQPGLRASYFSGGSYAHVSPRLTAQFAVRPQRVVLRAGVGTEVQYLHRLRDRYSFVYDLVSSRWIPAGPGVRPSRSVQAGLGVEVRPAAGLTVTLEAYGNQARDVLLPEDAYRTKDGLEGPGVEVGALLGQYVPAEARLYGVEAAVHYGRGPWQLWASYAGGRSLSRSDALGETRYRPSRFDVPRTLRGIGQYREGRWRYGVSVEARSGYPHSVPVSRYVLGDPFDDEPVAYLHRPEVNNGRLPPYLRLDATVGYHFGLLGAAWQAQLHVYNVLNKRNVVGRQYDPGYEVVRITDRRGLPLLPLLELEMTL